MTYKIKHEKLSYKIISAVSIILWFEAIVTYFSITEKMSEKPVWFTWVFICVLIVLFAASSLYFIEQVVGTKISFEDENLTIHYLFEKKRIALNEISNIHIERYKRYRRKRGAYTEYRLRMTITPYNGKNIVLTDTAMTVKGVIGFLFGIRSELSDEDVSLYKVYQMIQANCI